MDSISLPSCRRGSVLRMVPNEFNSTWLVMGLAAIHAVAIDLPHHVLTTEWSWPFMVFALAVNTFANGLIFYWLAGTSAGRWFVIPLIFAVNVTALYVAVDYRMPLDGNSIAILLETDISEAREFVGARLIFWLVASLAAGVFTAIAAGRIRIRKFPFMGTVGSALAIAATFTLWLPFGSADPEDYRGPMPVLMTTAVIGYAVERAKLRWSTAGRIDVSTLPIDRPGGDVEVILVIGESARGKNFALNGYGRQTTPLLGQMGVISFRQVRSCGAITRIAVPCLLTRATLADHQNLQGETSLVSVFRRLGYRTSWFSNQRLLGKADSLVFSFAEEAEFKVFNDEPHVARSDAAILPRILTHFATPRPRQLTVIHTIGSHWSYTRRYPEAFERFKPVCKASAARDCPQQELINSYDNSILYTDYMLASFIEAVKDRNAFLLFVSDHGESLGEDKFYLHGRPDRKEQRDVPLIFWASEGFKKAHPGRYDAVSRNRHEAITHDHVFHSLLDCAGIEAEAIDRRLSICR